MGVRCMDAYWTYDMSVYQNELRSVQLRLVALLTVP